MTRFLFTALLAVQLLLVSPEGEEALLSPEQMKNLDKIARELAWAGRAEESREVLDILRVAAYPAEALDELAALCGERLEEAGEIMQPQTAMATRLQLLVKNLAIRLSRCEGFDRARLARLILRLDSDHAKAHAALGHKRVKETWQSQDAIRLRKGRKEIMGALQQIRRMGFSLRTAPSALEYFKAHEVQGIWVLYEGMILHSTLSQEQCKRILTNSLRALTFSTYLRGGKMSRPKLEEECICLLVDSRARYLEAVDFYEKKGTFTADQAQVARKLTSFTNNKGFRIIRHLREDLSSTILHDDLSYGWQHKFYQGEVQPFLFAGHMNWVSLTLLGTTLPDFAWDEHGLNLDAHSRSGPDYAQGESNLEAVLRDRNLMLAYSSIHGCRSWLMGLVEKRLDPPLVQLLQTRAMSDVKGAVLLKSTLIAEYLQERGVLGEVLKETAYTLTTDGVGENPEPAKLFASAVCMSPEAFDGAWRAWLLPEKPGLIQRLKREVIKGAPDPGNKDLLAHLDKLRKAIWDEEALGPFAPLEMEPSLCDGARAHAVYLDRHGNQARSWPGCHEEYTDRKGYSPEGCWAGQHSLVAPLSPDSTACAVVDQWMASFYHRLPLLNPGLVRTAWGRGRKNGVLDVGTLVLPARQHYTFLWPPHNMENVPCRFMPEMPNPVPQKKQEDMGYPITLQWYPQDAANRYSLTLYQGLETEEKQEVPAYLSTPWKPLNPELVPINAICLIPRSPLKRQVIYTVRITDLNAGEEQLCRFMTR